MTRRDSTQESGKINFRTTAMPERARLCQEKLSLVLFRATKRYLRPGRKNCWAGRHVSMSRGIILQERPTEILGVKALHGEKGARNVSYILDITPTHQS